MIKLSERLQVIADFVISGESLADIGTDHGFLPLYLYERGICPKVVLSDINRGPLEKTEVNINKYCPGKAFDLRLGKGISTIEKGEVDVIVIAGMGGLLIADIIEEEKLLAQSFKKFILQPRNAQDKLRQYLVNNGFSIVNEKLVVEGKFLCEVLVAQPKPSGEPVTSSKLFQQDLDYEISPILFNNKDPLLNAYISNKIRIEEKILKDLKKSTKDESIEQATLHEDKIAILKALLKRSLSL